MGGTIVGERDGRLDQRVSRKHGVTCAAIPTTGLNRTIGELVATAGGVERDGVRHALLGATSLSSTDRALVRLVVKIAVRS